MDPGIFLTEDIRANARIASPESHTAHIHHLGPPRCAKSSTYEDLVLLHISRQTSQHYGGFPIFFRNG